MVRSAGLNREAARAEVCAATRELLGLEPSAGEDLLDQDPYDLGLDSLALFRLRARLVQRTHVALDVVALMDATTLDEIAMQLVRESGQAQAPGAAEPR